MGTLAATPRWLFGICLLRRRKIEEGAGSPPPMPFDARQAMASGRPKADLLNFSGRDARRSAVVFRGPWHKAAYLAGLISIVLLPLLILLPSAP
jgi:hypothetical protein